MKRTLNLILIAIIAICSNSCVKEDPCYILFNGKQHVMCDGHDHQRIF